MLDDRQLEEYLVRLGTSAWAADYIRRARRESPSRQVGGGEASMTVTWVSEKMTFTQDLESRTHELVYARQCDADPYVLEIWAQPPAIRVYAPDKTGRRSGHWYTPDFLILAVTRFFLAQIKKTSELEKLSAKKPEQWQLIQGRWHYLPADSTCNEVGLIHETYCTEDLNPVLARNYIFLRDYRDASSTVLPPIEVERLIKSVSSPYGMIIADLLPPRGNFAADMIYLAISRSLIYAPLSEQDLCDTVRCRLFVDRSSYDIFKAYSDEHRGKISE